MCQGLLNIFIKPHADRHVITYNKSKIVRSSVGSSRVPYRDAVIDFGSFKETIEIDPSDYGSGQNYYPDGICRKSMDSDHGGSIQAYSQGGCYANNWKDYNLAACNVAAA